MLIKLTGSIVGIATSAYFISSKAYAKDLGSGDAATCPRDALESALLKVFPGRELVNGSDELSQRDVERFSLWACSAPQLHTPKQLWDSNWDRRDPQAVYSELKDPPSDKCDIPAEEKKEKKQKR